jgi:hypothetical protein
MRERVSKPIWDTARWVSPRPQNLTAMGAIDQKNFDHRRASASRSEADNAAGVNVGIGRFSKRSVQATGFTASVSGTTLQSTSMGPSGVEKLTR